MIKFCLHRVLMVAVFIQFSSCIDEVPFPVAQHKDGVNISAVISDSFELQKVFIVTTTAVGFGTSVDGTPLSKAVVNLVSDHGDQVAFSESKKPGEYDAVFRPNYDQHYRLEVTLKDGRIYRSTFKSVENIHLPFSISSKLETRNFLNSNQVITSTTKVSLKLNTSLSLNNNSYKALYRISGEYAIAELATLLTRKTCYVKENIDYNRIVSFDGAGFPGGLVRDETIYEVEPDYKFYDQYCFHIDQYLVDQDTYTYFEKNNRLVQEGASVFSSPAGRISGNIYNTDDSLEQVPGYFFIGAKSGTLHFTNSIKLGAHVQARCDGGDPNIRVGPECFECLTLPNSSRIRPPYWQ